jgi:hypothetical protein
MTKETKLKPKKNQKKGLKYKIRKTHTHTHTQNKTFRRENFYFF